jgi:2-methylaconitate cis-trans-isomerase PrpF
MTTTFGEQTRVRCVQMRGGTSKGLYFHADDLPGPGAARDRLLQRLMGAPDVLEIDGLGGSRPITSKVAIITRSDRDDADVDYTFAQVNISQAGVFYGGNCGNISSGVGPFSIDEGLVPVSDGTTRVRIYNTNTDAVIIADVPVHNGRAKIEGDFSVPGVPGTGAEIAMNWVGTVGAKTGHLLPTGNAADTITLENGKAVEISIVDAANPLVFLHADEFGIDGSELADAIDSNTTLLSMVNEARGKAACLIGMCTDWQKVDEESPGLPIPALIAPPKNYATLSGTTAHAPDMDARVRVIFMGKLHESVPGTGSICLAAASRIPGSVVHKLATMHDEDRFRIGHPSGITPTKVTARAIDESPHVTFDVLGFSRTARRLMDSNAYVPTRLFDSLASTGDHQSLTKDVVHEG